MADMKAIKLKLWQQRFNIGLWSSFSLFCFFIYHVFRYVRTCLSRARSLNRLERPLLRDGHRRAEERLGELWRGVAPLLRFGPRCRAVIRFCYCCAAIRDVPRRDPPPLLKQHNLTRRPRISSSLYFLPSLSTVSCSDGDFSFLLTLGGMVRMFALCLITVKIHTHGEHAAGKNPSLVPRTLCF